MAAVFLNDLGANPYILAEEGAATGKKVKVRAFVYREADNPAHEAVIEDSSGRLVVSLTDAAPSVEYDGWVHGLTVRSLPSGYVIVPLMSK